jgi:hypothetical protein
MSNQRKSLTVINSYSTLNELTQAIKNTSVTELKRSLSKDFDKEKPILKRTKTITIKPRTSIGEADEYKSNRTSKKNGADNNHLESRTDVYGNKIIKGGRNKSYKVSFIDKTSNKGLTEVVEVTSYKMFYGPDDDDDEEEGNRSSFARCSCGCYII